MEYIRLCGALTNGKPNGGKLIPSSKVFDAVTNYDTPHFKSIFTYTQAQYEAFKKAGTVSGIDDVTTKSLYWDFDEKDNLEAARLDAIALCRRLEERGVNPDNLIISFSGYKGYGVELLTNRTFTPAEAGTLCLALVKGLETRDNTMYNASRVWRIMGTRHPDSGLYKIPLSFTQLNELSVEDIKELATTNETPFDSRHWIPVDASTLDLTIEAEVAAPAIVKPKMDLDIDFTRKIKGWTNCKWAMLQGYGIKGGNRHEKLLSIIATCKALNYPESQAYYAAKDAVKKGVLLYGCEDATKEEIGDRVKTIYSPTWSGGTYSCRDGKSPWLTELCNELGSHKCKGQDLAVVSASEVFGLFENYATNFDKNVLNTGIKPLDERAKLLVGNSNGILAPPGVGKSSLAFEILNHNSKAKVNSIFFSYDMFHSMVYLRLIQKHTGLQQDKVFDIFKHDKKKAQEIRAIIENEYKHVHFCFQSGQTAEEIQDTIRETQDKIQDKVKLVIVDYNELVITNISDPTQSSAQVAQKMRQIANEEEVCVLSLLQPAKVHSNPADEISTYQGAKGSGAIAQSLSLMLSLSRPGFHPRRPEQDKFFTINALKHRQGPLFTIDMGWEGLTGKIKELSPEERDELKEVRMMKESEKNKEKDSY